MACLCDSSCPRQSHTYGAAPGAAWPRQAVVVRESGLAPIRAAAMVGGRRATAPCAILRCHVDRRAGPIVIARAARVAIPRLVVRTRTPSCERRAWATAKAMMSTVDAGDGYPAGRGDHCAIYGVAPRVAHQILFSTAFPHGALRVAGAGRRQGVGAEGRKGEGKRAVMASVRPLRLAGEERSPALSAPGRRRAGRGSRRYARRVFRASIGPMMEAASSESRA